MSQENADPQKVGAFAERLLGILNSGAPGLMTSIGHRTGLFDAMGELPSSTIPSLLPTKTAPSICAGG